MRLSVRNKLKLMKRQLMTAPRMAWLNKPSWKDKVPGVGGVYVIWTKAGRPKYVGETCQLNHRCYDLERAVNHTFRWKMAKEYGMKKINDDVLSRKLSKEFRYSYLPVDFGRKELEEYLVVEWAKTIINKPPKRLLLRE